MKEMSNTTEIIDLSLLDDVICISDDEGCSQKRQGQEVDSSIVNSTKLDGNDEEISVEKSESDESPPQNQTFQHRLPKISSDFEENLKLAIQKSLEEVNNSGFATKTLHKLCSETKGKNGVHLPSYLFYQKFGIYHFCSK